MNRPIKFRAWHHIENKMYYPIDIFNANNGIWYEDEKDGALHINQITDSYGGRERLVMMQFTGLKDKNNREVYEGDIYNEYYKFVDIEKLTTLIDSRYIYNDGHFYPCEKAESTFILTSEVYWDDEWNCYHAKRKNKLTGKIEKSHWFPFMGDNIEVIGNVFENPELITLNDRAVAG